MDGFVSKYVNNFEERNFSYKSIFFLLICESFASSIFLFEVNFDKPIIGLHFLLVSSMLTKFLEN